MVRKLTFVRAIGKFKVGESYDLENELQADSFINNGFATEELETADCGCNKTADTVVEEAPAEATPKKVTTKK